jgi:hypothetical protein
MVKGISGILCAFVGLALVGMGVYVHYVTVMDIPAAAMTQRLELSGWEWDVGGAIFFFISWLCLKD